MFQSCSKNSASSCFTFYSFFAWSFLGIYGPVLFQNNFSRQCVQVVVPGASDFVICQKMFMSIFQKNHSVNLRIQSEYRKIRTRKYSVLGHFSRSEHLVQFNTFSQSFAIERYVNTLNVNYSLTILQ